MGISLGQTCCSLVNSQLFAPIHTVGFFQSLLYVLIGVFLKSPSGFRPVGRGGAHTLSPPPPQLSAEVHSIVNQQFGRLKLGTLLKDHDDQHC